MLVCHHEIILSYIQLFILLIFSSSACRSIMNHCCHHESSLSLVTSKVVFWSKLSIFWATTSSWAHLMVVFLFILFNRYFYNDQQTYRHSLFINDRIFNLLLSFCRLIFSSLLSLQPCIMGIFHSNFLLKIISRLTFPLISNHVSLAFITTDSKIMVQEYF